MGVAQLPELPAAGGSPVAPKKDEQQLLAALVAEEVGPAVGAGEGEVGSKGAERDGDAFHRWPSDLTFDRGRLLEMPRTLRGHPPRLDRRLAEARKGRVSGAIGAI